MRRRLLAIHVILFSIVGTAAASQGTQRISPADVLTAQMSQGDTQSRIEAARAALALGPDLQTHEMWVVVASELARATRIVKAHRDASLRGEQDKNDPLAPMYQEVLAALAARSSDAVVIPALVSILDRGALAPTALSRFGARAVPELVERACADTASLGDVTGALMALAMILESENAGDLDPADRQRVRTVVDRRLRRGEDGLVLLVAVDVAVGLRDPGLDATLRRYLSSSGAVEDLGLTKTQVTAFQRRIQQALEKRVER